MTCNPNPKLANSNLAKPSLLYSRRKTQLGSVTQALIISRWTAVVALRTMLLPFPTMANGEMASIRLEGLCTSLSAAGTLGMH